MTEYTIKGLKDGVKRRAQPLAPSFQDKRGIGRQIVNVTDPDGTVRMQTVRKDRLVEAST